MNLWRVDEMLYFIIICLIVFIVAYQIFEIMKELIKNIELEKASLLAKKCFTPGKCYTVCTHYEPSEEIINKKKEEEEEELTLRVKDRIYIIEVYPDGRALGKNVITEQTGIFPLCHLKNKDGDKRMKYLKVKETFINSLSSIFLSLLFIFLLHLILAGVLALIWNYNGYD